MRRDHIPVMCALTATARTVVATCALTGGTLGCALVACAVVAAGLSSPVLAQQQDSARAGVSAPAPPLAPGPAAAKGLPPTAVGTRSRPPVSPRSAFLSSLLLPGYGQAKLDRGYAGGLFFSVEVVALAMLRQAEIDLHYAQRHSHDSTLVVLTYEQDSTTGTLRRDSTGAPIPSTFAYARYDSTRVAARKTHVEDWLAVLIFNHLIAGADAFVAAQLWDLPGHVHPSVSRAANGRMLIGAASSW